MQTVVYGPPVPETLRKIGLLGLAWALCALLPIGAVSSRASAQAVDNERPPGASGEEEEDEEEEEEHEDTPAPATPAEPENQAVLTSVQPAQATSAAPTDNPWAIHPEENSASSPARLVFTVTGGGSFRLVKNTDYAQRFAGPAYLDLFGAYVFPGSGLFRHGAGFGVSANLTGDGKTIGIDPFTQFSFSPTYLAYLRFNDDWTAFGHASIPIGFTAQPGTTETQIGFEIGVGATYWLTAGFGPYVEGSASVYWGEAYTIHPLVSGEVGIVIDYEVL